MPLTKEEQHVLEQYETQISELVLAYRKNNVARKALLRSQTEARILANTARMIDSPTQDFPATALVCAHYSSAEGVSLLVKFDSSLQTAVPLRLALTLLPVRMLLPFFVQHFVSLDALAFVNQTGKGEHDQIKTFFERTQTTCYWVKKNAHWAPARPPKSLRRFQNVAAMRLETMLDLGSLVESMDARDVISQKLTQLCKDEFTFLVPFDVNEDEDGRSGIATRAQRKRKQVSRSGSRSNPRRVSRRDERLGHSRVRRLRRLRRPSIEVIEVIDVDETDEDDEDNDAEEPAYQPEEETKTQVNIEHDDLNALFPGLYDPVQTQITHGVLLEETMKLTQQITQQVSSIIESQRVAQSIAEDNFPARFDSHLAHNINSPTSRLNDWLQARVDSRLDAHLDSRLQPLAAQVQADRLQLYSLRRRYNEDQHQRLEDRAKDLQLHDYLLNQVARMQAQLDVQRAQLFDQQ
jgi:hypothetical protein